MLSRFAEDRDVRGSHGRLDVALARDQREDASSAPSAPGESTGAAGVNTASTPPRR